MRSLEYRALDGRHRIGVAAQHQCRAGDRRQQRTAVGPCGGGDVLSHQLCRPGAAQHVEVGVHQRHVVDPVGMERERHVAGDHLLVAALLDQREAAARSAAISGVSGRAVVPSSAGPCTRAGAWRSTSKATMPPIDAPHRISDPGC